MLCYDVYPTLTEALLLTITPLLDAAFARSGIAALSDQHLSDLASGRLVGAVGVVARHDDVVVGYAQSAATNGVHSIEVVTDSNLAVEAADILLRTIAPLLDRHEGTTVNWWVHGEITWERDIAFAHGFQPGRALYQMQCPLPLDHPPSAVVTRPLRVGDSTDLSDWLRVNNRAFHAHAEQGAWDEKTLNARIAEPWFDPRGFLVHERDGRVAAFCWTKHHHTEPPMGEIYVIAVDPDYHGLGLGRQLTVAGLEHLAATGLHIGLLYVDADNTAAVGLYRSLGFDVTRTDSVFTKELT